MPGISASALRQHALLTRQLDTQIEADMNLVIIGGVAGGATAAARARRLDEETNIVLFERGPDVSFANCGLPYHIGGEIRERDALLVQTVAGLRMRFNLDLRTEHEVTAIDSARRMVRARCLATGQENETPYDALLLSPGAAPVRPPIPGCDLPNVFTLRNMADMDRIKQAVDAGAQRALVVGGGFIGLEMVENLVNRGLEVTLVELLPQLMPPLDPEVVVPLQKELEAHGVDVRLQTCVQRLEAAGGTISATLQDDQTLQADLVLLATGVRPDTALAKEAGLKLNERGAIVVDEQMRTSDPHIYAVGDAVEISDPISGGRTMIPLAGPANRQARIAIDSIFGRTARYRGTQGTSIVRVFRQVAASTGLSEKALRRTNTPYRKIYVHRGQHAGYYPGAQMLMIKLLFTPDDGRILGAQVVGPHGADKRIDVLAMAIQARMTVADLEEAELAYAPQFGSAKDPVNIAGFVATNLLRGEENLVYAEDLLGAPNGASFVIDVRDPEEFETGHIPGAVLIPLPQLRSRLEGIPRDRDVIVYCGVGQRGYYAERILRQHGLNPRNLAGGFRTYGFVEATQRVSGK